MLLPMLQTSRGSSLAGEVATPIFEAMRAAAGLSPSGNGADFADTGTPPGLYSIPEVASPELGSPGNDIQQELEQAGHSNEAPPADGGTLGGGPSSAAVPADEANGTHSAPSAPPVSPFAPPSPGARPPGGDPQDAAAAVGLVDGSSGSRLRVLIPNGSDAGASGRQPAGDAVQSAMQNTRTAELASLAEQADLR